jgi:glycosyltransferase involved in cell wall biosynthesis
MNIFYFAYDHQKPTGGQKSAYRHVDALNRNGFSAFVLHSTENFRLGWFQNTTRVAGPAAFRSLYNVNEDWIVLPEDLGPSILTYPGKKIIINQGPYLGFACFGLKAPEQYPYLHPEVRAVFVKSSHSHQYLRFAFPKQTFIRVFNGADPHRLPFVSLEQKKKIIAAPRHKNQLDLMQVYNILMSRSQQGLNALAGYQWMFFDAVSEEEVARILGDTFLFIFLSTIEGFGRLPVEAMLSGCVVAAYSVAPLTEYLTDENALLCDRGDVVAVVSKIEKAVSDFSTNPAALKALTLSAHSSALEFSLEREEKSALAAWKQVLEKNPS